MAKVDTLYKMDNITMAARNHDLEKIEAVIDAAIRTGKFPPCWFPEALEQSMRRGETCQAAQLLAADSAYTEFRITGQIGDALLPFFDQTGAWLGPTSCTEHEFDDICRVRIPKEKTTRLDPDGSIHLLTAFVTKDEEPLRLPYRSVGGRIIATKAKAFDAPNLQEARGDIEMDAAQWFSTPDLTHGDGNIDAGKASTFLAPELVRVQGRLDAGQAKDFRAPKLLEVGSVCKTASLKVLRLPQLTKITCLRFSLEEIKREKEKRLREMGAVAKIRAQGNEVEI